MSAEFDPKQSLGAMSSAEIAAYLQDIGDIEGASAFVHGGVRAQAGFLFHRAYKPTGMMVGFVAPHQTNAAPQLPIASVGSVAADPQLIKGRIKITLDKFYVHEYPGLGKHTILCEFSGRNQVAQETEELRFALRFEANDKSGASLSGVPIFMGLTVGPDGISFVGRTIHVESEIDNTILATLDSPAFKSGLSLISTAQPALKPFAGLATAAVKTIAERKKNKQIHTFNLGLDFGAAASSARLRLGTYLVVQTDDEEWKWSNFHWDVDSQNLRSSTGEIPAVNYMAFSVGTFVG